MTTMKKLNPIVIGAFIAILLAGTAALAVTQFDSLRTKLLDWIGTTAPSLSAAGHGSIYFNSGTSKMMLSENGGAYVPLVPTAIPTSTPAPTVTPAATVTPIPTATAIPTPTAVPSTSFKMTFSGNTGATALDNAAVNYITAMGRGVSATQSDVWQLTAYAGVHRKLFCQTQGTPGGAASYAFLVCPNGACPAGPPTCTITSAIQSCSDTVTTYNGSANDTVSIKVTPAGAPTARTAQCTFEYDAS